MTHALQIPGTEAVVFGLGAARRGWIDLTIMAGNQQDQISCSHVFDPFADLTSFIENAVDMSMSGCVAIDEEGHYTIIRLDFEPGALCGRLRVFEPGRFGEGIDALRVDAPVDLLQLAAAWLAACDDYDLAQHRDWHPDVAEKRLLNGETMSEVYGGERIRRVLADYGLVPIDADPEFDPLNTEYRATCRRRYAEARGGSALSR